MPMRTISALAGTPRTKARTDAAGKPIFDITPRVLTPGRAKLADLIHGLLSALWLIRCIFAFFNFPVFGLAEVCQTAVMFGIGHFTLRFVIVAVLRTKTEIIMTTDLLCERRWLNRHEYDRHLIQGFAVIPHDRADIERFNQEFEKAQAASKGKVIQPTPYLARSCHVVASYAGQRVDLLTVYGLKEAAAIAARLQLCHQLLDEAIGIQGRSGVAARPDREWQGTPGGLHHE